MQLMNSLAAALAGAVLASLAVTGLVYAETAPPASNPAEKPILVYGENVY